MGPKGEPGEYVGPEVSSSFFALSLPLLGCCSGIGYDFSPAEGVEGWEEWGELEGPGHPPLWWLMGIPLEVLRPQSQHSSFPGAGDSANLLWGQESEAAFTGARHLESVGAGVLVDPRCGPAHLGTPLQGSKGIKRAPGSHTWPVPLPVSWVGVGE